jgi:hypothetical protein
MPLFGLLFTQLRIWIAFDKNGLGYILGDFFSIPSGHPAADAIFVNSDIPFFRTLCTFNV